MLNWKTRNPEALGLIPLFLSENDPRPAKEQLHENYLHGGGWRPFEGFILGFFNLSGAAFLDYPGDLPMREVGRAELRSELIIVFECSWVCIVQPDDTYEIARMD
jgi:hypothetical protein